MSYTQSVRGLCGGAPGILGLARPYAAILSARLRTQLQYRAAALAGAFTQLFWGMMLVMIYSAFFRSAPGQQPMSYQQVVVYVWLGQAMLLVVPWSLDPEIRAMLRSGTVVYELLRPVDLYTLWYCRDLARRVASASLRALPIFAIAGVFLGLSAPPSWASAAAWLLTTIGACLLSTALCTLVCASMLWTISGEGVATLVFSLAMLLSGLQVPLPLLPAWAQRVVSFLPFSSLVDVPARFYIGHLPPNQLLPRLAVQMGWTAALVFAGRLLIARGVRRLVVQGG